jgi:cold shock CspA family protein
MRGIVKLYNESAGWGFIRVPGQNDCFFHIGRVREGELSQRLQSGYGVGTEVEFETEPSDKKPGRVRAKNFGFVATE